MFSGFHTSMLPTGAAAVKATRPKRRVTAETFIMTVIAGCVVRSIYMQYELKEVFSMGKLE